MAMFVCTSQNTRLTTTCSASPTVNAVDTLNATFITGNTPALAQSNPIVAFLAMQIDALHAEAQQNDALTRIANSDISNACSLTDHLLPWHSPQLEHGIINLLFIVLTFAVFAGAGLLVPVLTEPIIPTQRRHLTFCVFRE
ncbi:hypothetical protein L4C36_16735 [Photobacterium japonica]|uniref:hypothetical protein n=1 Tax=Photobacterium japonica TaxID=2910235 RepID=UPI003D0C946E